MTSPRPRSVKIAFDTWVLGPQAMNQGVHVYARELLQRFQRLAAGFSVEIAAYVRHDKNGGDTIYGDRIQQRKTHLLKHSRLWRYGGACAVAAFDRADLVFSPHYSTLYSGSVVPTVTTIFDVIPVVLPWKARAAKILRFFLWSAVRSSRAIITASEHSKKDLIRLYGLADSQIHVIYLGCDHHIFNRVPPNSGLLKQVKQTLGITRPYILHCGAIKPNKNLKRLVLAFDSLLQREHSLNLDLVLVGTPDSAYDEVSQVAEAVRNPRGRVILAGAVPEQKLIALIKGAKLAVFPSLYEGFCLPMIESMACGIPVIAANSSCLPEISGEGLRYFDPESVPDISACMEAVLKDGNLQKQLAEIGFARAARFDWERCAGETLALLAHAARDTRMTRSRETF